MLLQLLNKEVFQWIKYSTVKINRMETIKIKQVHSAIKKPADQKATIKALGFRRLNHIVEKEVTPQILGMINKVKHLIIVVD